MELKCTLVLLGLFLMSSESHECDPGFRKTSMGCVDEDECEMPDLCGKNVQCFNLPGSYYCTCDEGFQSNPANFTATTGQCVDINECVEKTHECSDEQRCVNNAGSYRCSCPEGCRYNSRLGTACLDVDECVTWTLCGENAHCFNTPGSYYCNCDEGFKSNPANFTATTGQCLDINECVEKTHECSDEQKCVNNAGSYRCVCPEGYRYNSRLDSPCEDIDDNM